MILVSIIFELIIELIVKGGGFILGILALYFMWKSRTTPYKEILYSKQLEGYLKLVESMETIISVILDRMLSLTKDEKDERFYFNPLELPKEYSIDDFMKDIEKFKSKLNSCKSDYADIFVKWSIILPKELRDSFKEFIKTINIKDLNPEKIFDARKKVFKIAYHKLGIEPLSKEIRNMIEK